MDKNLYFDFRNLKLSADFRFAAAIGTDLRNKFNLFYLQIDWHQSSIMEEPVSVPSCLNQLHIRHPLLPVVLTFA